MCRTSKSPVFGSLLSPGLYYDIICCASRYFSFSDVLITVQTGICVESAGHATSNVAWLSCTCAGLENLTLHATPAWVFQLLNASWPKFAKVMSSPIMSQLNQSDSALGSSLKKILLYVDSSLRGEAYAEHTPVSGSSFSRQPGPVPIGVA